ncbi:MAG: GTPase HflX [Firmicutes bacterium]|nr:GTPase HflX [Bacillota bacterium]
MIRIREDGTVVDREEYRAILVGVSLGEDIDYSMEELKGLAEADGIEVLGIMTQNVEKINAAHFLGSGKLKELAEFVENMEADLVVFNDELSGMQLRNIEDVCGCRIIDRTILILDIFADRATSMEGKLQVELAQLQYRMPRLLGFGKSLSRLGGGIGTRGPGETKLETDRRHIQHRMDEIKKTIAEVKANRSVQRSRRQKSGLPVAALVGYTNAGKSSIMNRLLAASEKEEKQVFEKDMLFATLDTAQRLITLDDRCSFILIDTVGFVSKLPHALVDAFKATLEEVTYADLLIHVVDASFEGSDFQTEVTRSVLKELGADEKPILTVYNKTDLVDPEMLAEKQLTSGKDSCFVSTKTGAGYEELLAKIRAGLFADLQTVRLLIPYDKGSAVSAILAKTTPSEVKYEENGTLLTVDLNEEDRGRYREYILQ